MTTAVVYRTAPNMEHKAADELRRAGIRAYVPRDRASRRSPFTGKHQPPAPGYVFAKEAAANAFAKHAKGKPLGTVSKAELGRLYLERPKATPTARPFAPGDKVTITAGPFANLTGTVTEDRGRIYRVDVALFGTMTPASVHTQHMRKFDPG